MSTSSFPAETWLGCDYTGFMQVFRTAVSSGGQNQKLLGYKLLKTNGIHMRLKLST